MRRFTFQTHPWPLKKTLYPKAVTHTAYAQRVKPGPALQNARLSSNGEPVEGHRQVQRLDVVQNTGFW